MAKSESTTELWKTIPEFSNYQVSSKGRVRRRTNGPATFAGRILKAHTQKECGYIAIKLVQNGATKTFHVHVLVATAFLPPKPTPKHEVNHKDGIKENCVVDNLEWATRQENQQHARRLGLHYNQVKGERSHLSKLTENDVRRIRSLLSETQLTHRQIGELVGISRSNVSSISRRQVWKHVN